VRARSAATPILLVLLAACAAGYAYVVDRHAVSDADRALRQSDVFPSFRVEDVGRVELIHDRESTVLEREGAGHTGSGGGWRIASPRQEGADAAAVDALLRELELAKRLRVVAANDAPGLDAPRVRGSVFVGPIRYVFVLGADARRPEGAAYMRLEGDATFVIGRSLKMQLLRGADAYRERALVPYGASEVGRLEVRALDGKAGFALERTGETFRVAGTGMRASRAAVDHIFAALADTRADSFVDDAQAVPHVSGSAGARSGLDRAVAATPFEITLAARDAALPSVRFRIGGACADQPQDVLVVRETPTRVSACTAKTLVDAIDSTKDALLDDSPLFAHADEIEEVRLEPVEGEGPRVEIARRERVWRERTPEDKDLSEDESDSANALVLALAQARGDIRSAGGDERFAPRARATIVRAGEAAPERIEVGAPGRDRTALLRRVDDGALLRVPLAVARRFEPHPVALRGRAVWQVPFDAGSVVAVDNTCGPVRERLELHDRTWIMRTPAGFDADASSISDLADALAHTKASAWIAETDDGTFGLSGPEGCTIAFTLGGTSDAAPLRRAAITFGSNGDLGTYARTASGMPEAPSNRASSGEAVFVAPGFLRTLASYLSIDRVRFRLDPASLVSVTLSHGPSRLALVRTGERLASVGSGAADAHDVDWGGVLAGLDASAAIHTGPPIREEGFLAPTLEIQATGVSDAGAVVERRIAIGAATHAEPFDAYFARVSGVNATFLVPQQAVRAILDSL
jgi:hypothetical protein